MLIQWELENDKWEIILKNPLTYRVESSLGAVFICLLSLFFIGLLFIAVKNFETDVDIMTTTGTGIKTLKISGEETVLIKDWISRNNVIIPSGSGYRYLLRKYPDRPWLD